MPKSSKWSPSFNKLDAQPLSSVTEGNFLTNWGNYQLNREDSVPDWNHFHTQRQCIKLSSKCKVKFSSWHKF
jgi:hypothetical protein